METEIETKIVKHMFSRVFRPYGFYPVLDDYLILNADFFNSNNDFFAQQRYFYSIFCILIDIFISITVRSTFQCSATLGVYLVRGTPGISQEKYVPTSYGNSADRDSISVLLDRIHHCATFCDWSDYEEAFYKVHLPFSFVFYFSM